MGRVTRFIRRVLRRAPPPLRGLFDPPDEDGALVPRRPLRPLGSGSVALAPPEESRDTDARGFEA